MTGRSVKTAVQLRGSVFQKVIDPREEGSGAAFVMLQRSGEQTSQPQKHSEQSWSLSQHGIICVTLSLAAFSLLHPNSWKVLGAPNGRKILVQDVSLDPVKQMFLKQLDNG